MAICISITCVFLTGISIGYFYNLLKRSQYKSGTWLFVSQQVILQICIVLAESIFYFKHMRRMYSTASPPIHFQLDTAMLIFPLIPLGVLLTLRVLPDLIQLREVFDHHLTASETLWAVINTALALFNYFQVAFQASFISEAFCRLRFGGLRKSGYFFLVLGILNFCIWLSWTLECKLVTLHGRSFKIFGVVEWIIVVYATVPFVVFCFAHSSACLFELMLYCLQAHPPADTNEHNEDDTSGLIDNRYP